MLLETAQTAALAAMAERSMRLSFTIQDGHVFVASDAGSVELTPREIKAAQGR